MLGADTAGSDRRGNRGDGLRGPVTVIVAIPTMLRRRLSDAAGVDAAGERGRDGVELGFQAGVLDCVATFRQGSMSIPSTDCEC
jgi:hypothetical protein